MLSIIAKPYIVNAVGSCDNPMHIQFAQVQDATNSFKQDAAAMQKFMKGIVQSVSDQFEGPMDYALTAFTDKPQVITGSGKNDGVWKNYPHIEDYCYKQISKLSSEVKIDGLVIGGGKDSHENQLDALAMAAVDPNLGWINDEKDEDGNLVVKLAVLVTDAGHHRASERDTADESKRNWYHEELFRGPCNYTDRENCDELYGFGTSRSGVTLSLTGVLGHYQHFKVGNDVELLTNAEYYGWDKRDDLNAYRYCCTNIINTWPNQYYSRCNDKFRTWDQCAAASCKYCNANGCKKVCNDAMGNTDYSADWFKQIEIPDITVNSYVYGKERFDVESCSTMEYPDPFSQEYADVFLKSGVNPVFFIRQAGKELAVNEGSSWVFGYDAIAMANHTCPKVGQRLAKHWLCHSNPALQVDGGITGATNACEGYDVSELKPDTFYADCFNEHYGEVVESLQEKGVNAYYVLVDKDVTGEALLRQLVKKIEEIVYDHPSCHRSSTHPQPVPTTTIKPPTVSTKATIPTTNLTTRTKPATVSTKATISTTNLTTTRTEPATVITKATIPVSTADEHSTPDDDDTTKGYGGQPTGVFIGSAAAGVIVAAAAVYAKGLILGMRTSPRTNYIEEADIPNDAVEREQVQVVDANMFL